jgi:hypothetical protein
MSQNNQEVVVYLVSKADLNVSVGRRTVVAACSTVDENTQKLFSQMADAANEEFPPATDLSDEDKALHRDFFYLQALGMRAGEVTGAQMGKKYICLRVAVIDGPMKGLVMVNARHATGVDPKQIEQLEGGIVTPLVRTGKLH